MTATRRTARCVGKPHLSPMIQDISQQIISHHGSLRPFETLI